MFGNEIEKKLVQARVNMLFKHPFFGQLALRLQLEDASDQIPTAATDGRKLYYNRDFIAALDIEEVVFLLGHEIGHVMFEHFLRREDRDPKIWNMAGDYVINLMLEREGVGRVIRKVDILLDSKYAGMVSEEVYDKLIEDGAEPQQTLDVHLDMSGDGDGEGEGSGDGKGNEDGNGNGGLKPVPMTEEERRALADEIKGAVLQAAQSVGAGNLPAEVKRMIKDLTESKMDWREMLDASIESSIKSDFTWQRPNRKSQSCGVVLPGMSPDEEIDVCLAIDTSGSISTAMLREFVSEVAGIMSQYTEYRIRIWQFDTAVYGYDEFTHDDGRDITEYEIKGGGGTDFVVNWAFMEENGIEPHQFVMFTDGYPWQSWGDPDYCPTIFAIHGTTTIEAPFGDTVYYDGVK